MDDEDLTTDEPMPPVVEPPDEPEPEPERDPRRMTRPELDAFAAARGVDHPEHFPNKDALLDAIDAVEPAPEPVRKIRLPTGAVVRFHGDDEKMARMYPDAEVIG